MLSLGCRIITRRFRRPIWELLSIYVFSVPVRLSVALNTGRVEFAMPSSQLVWDLIDREGKGCWTAGEGSQDGDHVSVHGG
jgi:hypothetical protein